MRTDDFSNWAGRERERLVTPNDFSLFEAPCGLFDASNVYRSIIFTFCDILASFSNIELLFRY